jgi:hypothetical protein
MDIFNITLNVRYVHLTKRPNIFIREKPILSSQKMLHKEYDSKGSAKKKHLGMSPKSLGVKN